jgi:TatD DNase family protein
VVSFKNSGLDKAITNIPIKNMVLETDAPYLAPVPFRGKRNEPAYLKYVVEKLASIFGLSIEDVANKQQQMRRSCLGWVKELRINSY